MRSRSHVRHHNFGTDGVGAVGKAQIWFEMKMLGNAPKQNLGFCVGGALGDVMGRRALAELLSLRLMCVAHPSSTTPCLRYLNKS